MDKRTKISALKTAMTNSKRDDGTEFYHFADGDESTHEEIKELKDLYLEHYEVRDLDYQIFSEACDMLTEIYNDEEQEKDGSDFTIDQIYERSSDSASVYTDMRLSYLSMWNEDEISDTMRNTGTHSIADACAIWYDSQLEQAALVINEWVNK